jgi:hypothetical protein
MAWEKIINPSETVSSVQVNKVVDNSGGVSEAPIDYSVEAPLVLTDFSGYNQPYHPSVLFFSAGWNGYKYWMAQTPFPIGGTPYRDRWECPIIYRSQDGIRWENVVDPLDDLTPAEIANLDYFSDPHLVMNNGTLECWYRITRGNDSHTYILKKKSTDGVNWSERETMIDCWIYGMVRSHAIIIEDGKYKMWYTGQGLPNDVGYAESLDNGTTWGTRKLVVVDRKIWHLDAVKLDGKYYLLGYIEAALGNSLELYESVDGINFTYVKQILQKDKGFYVSGLYRSCIVKTDKDLRIYFSANTSTKTSIGVMAGTTFSDLKIINGQPPTQNRYIDELVIENETVNPKTTGWSVILDDGTSAETVIKDLLRRVYNLELN